MTSSKITIGQRIAKPEGALGYKVGTVKGVKDNLVLVDFDNHPNRWISINNLETVS